MHAHGMKLLDLGPCSGVYYRANRFFESRVERNRRRGGRGWLRFEELRARKEQFAVQLQDLVQFCRDVAAYDVLDAYTG
jgi:hypothetical protein